MSTYDYKCTVCNHVEEHVHSMTEQPEYLCSLCSNPMKKVILSTPNIDKYFPGSIHQEVINRPTNRTDW